MYRPEVETVPPVVVHVTVVFELPVTVAVNCCVPDVCKDEEVGLIETLTSGAVTVMVALADLVVSAALVAFTV